MIEAAVIALRVFMVVVGVLFFLFIVAYHMRMALPDWSSMPKPWQLWINTTILIFSSVALQLASNAAKAQQWKSMRIHLLMGGFLAISFLLGQLYSWQLLNEAGYFVASNPANSFFYLFTALHGVHLLGGLVAWSKPMLRLYRKGEIDTMQQRSTTVEYHPLCQLLALPTGNVVCFIWVAISHLNKTMAT